MLDIDDIYYTAPIKYCDGQNIAHVSNVNGQSMINCLMINFDTSASHQIWSCRQWYFRCCTFCVLGQWNRDFPYMDMNYQVINTPTLLTQWVRMTQYGVRSFCNISFVFTWDQFWPPGNVVAPSFFCVWPCVFALFHHHLIWQSRLFHSLHPLHILTVYAENASRSRLSIISNVCTCNDQGSPWYFGV